MHIPKPCFLRIAVLLLSFATFVPLHAEAPSAAAFGRPSDAFAPRAWWHWLDGNISREGITKDLQAMHAAGIRHVTLFDLGLRYPTGPVKEVLSEDWFDHVRFAVAEARRLGMKLGLTIHPGFSGAGGPWIAPEMSMKRLVWSDVIVEGGKPLDIILPEKPTEGAWTRDYAVVAWPVKGTFAANVPDSVSFSGRAVRAADLRDGNPFTRILCPRSGSAWRFDFAFPAECRASRVRLLFGEADYFRVRNERGYRLRVLADGHLVSEREIGAEGFRAPIELAFDATHARNYSLEIEAQDGPFNFTGRLFLAEAEFLQEGERARWPGAIRDWDRQISVGSGDAAEGGSFSMDAAAIAISKAEICDLTAFVRDGRLRWQCPPGLWRVLRFGYMSNGKEVRPTRPGAQGLESDKMSEAATNLAFQGYAKRILDALPVSDRGVFDLMLIDSWECGKQNWTDDFPAAFAARRGYSVMSFLPVLAGEVVSSPEVTGGFLNDFRQTIADLVTERFYGRAKKLANEAGLRLEAQIGDGQGVDPNWDVFAMARAVDLPMDEFWTEPDTERYPRNWQLADAAYLAGHRVVTAESFTGRRADWLNAPGNMQEYADVAFQRGVSQFALHSSVHQPAGKPPGLTLSGNGEHFTRTNTWWPFAGDWFEGIRRAQYVLQTTTVDSELLVYNGDTMPLPPPLWTATFSAPHRQFIDRPALLSRVTVRGGKLQLDGKGSYRALVLPGSRSIKRDALEKIKALVEEGATLVGLPPTHWTGLDPTDTPARLSELIASLWGDGQSRSSRLGRGTVVRTDNPAEMMAVMGFEGDLIAQTRPSGREPLEYAHRRADGTDVYFLRNPTAQATGFTCRVLDAVGRRPELWWEETGRIQPVPAYFHESGRVVFPVTLEAKQGVFLVLREPARSDGVRGLRNKDGDSDPYSASDKLHLQAATSGATVVFGDQPEGIVMTTADGLTKKVSVPAPIRLAIDSPWRLTFGSQAGGQSMALSDLVSWTVLPAPALRNYSGTAVYENALNVTAAGLNDLGAAELNLGCVAVVARVTVNGRPAGTRWRAPWTFDVAGLLHPGANSIRVEVANLWHNRLLADLRLPVAERVTATTPQAENFVRGTGPLPSGLLGPVTVTLFPKQAL